MEVFEANILLRNLIDRIEETDDGKGTLPGTVTSDEIAALRLALEALRGPSPAAPAVDTAMQPQIASPTSDSPDVHPEIQLDITAINSEIPPENVRFCLDFGTAMSKATLVRDTGEDTEEVEVLQLGVPGEQELVSEEMLVSSVFIDRAGQIWFGQKAVENSLQEGADGTHRRLDSIKRRLSEDGWDEKVNSTYNPTDEIVTYGEIILAYLAFLTWTANRCLEELGYSPLLCRRFAMPCFEGQQKRREFVERLGKAVGDAQVLADTFGNDLIQGLTLRRFVETSRTLRKRDYDYVFVDEEVTEPMGVARSMASGNARLDHLVLVVDIGAGTSDLGLYRIFVDPEKSTYVAREVKDSTRVLTEAGDHLDNLLIQFVLAKAGVKSDDPNIKTMLGQLNLRIRQYKESLFVDGSVFVAISGSPNHAGVDVELEEFCCHNSVRQFEQSLKASITDILERVDDSWVDWVWAHPSRNLVMLLAGGGAEMPMVKDLTEQSWIVNGKELPVRRALPVPDWLDQQMEDLYPRIAVSLGGARKNLIRETVANVTAGDVTKPAKIEGYYQKSGPGWCSELDGFLFSMDEC